jgi:hypothetical protein
VGRSALSARHALIYSGRRLSGTRGLRTTHGHPELTLDGNEIIRVEMNLTGYLEPDEKVLDCVLTTQGVEAARIVTPSKVVLKVRGSCHGHIDINVLTSSRERIRERIECRAHDGHYAMNAMRGHTWDYGHGTRRTGPMVAPPGPRIVRTPSWRHVCNMGNPMQNHTTSTKVPDYAVSGDLLYDPDRRAFYVWFNTGQYDEWVPLSRRSSNWNETDQFSDAFIQNKPILASKLQYTGLVPPDKFSVPPGTQFRHDTDDTLYVLVQVGPNQFEWEDQSA